MDGAHPLRFSPPLVAWFPAEPTTFVSVSVFTLKEVSALFFLFLWGFDEDFVLCLVCFSPVRGTRLAFCVCVRAVVCVRAGALRWLGESIAILTKPCVQIRMWISRCV